MMIIVGLIYVFYDKTILDYHNVKTVNIIDKGVEEDIYIEDNNIVEEIPVKTNKKESKGQKTVREYLEKRFGKKFIECRPDFLKNPKTGRNLEYDCYNEELQLAVEYNGKQHYELCSNFHKSPTDFQKQVLRDNIKMRLSEKNGISLIVVPYNIEHSNIPTYLEEKLTMYGY